MQRGEGASQARCDDLVVTDHVQLERTARRKEKEPGIAYAQLRLASGTGLPPSATVSPGSLITWRRMRQVGR